MSLFAALTQEHRLMLGLIVRIEHAFRNGDDEGGRRGLLVLYHALALHEEIEELVVRPASPGASAPLAAALALVARQHSEIERLRDETRALFERADCQDEDADRVRGLSLLLTRRLRAHFEVEERRLWPLLSARGGRAPGRALVRRANKGVVDLEERIRELQRSTAEYL